MNQSQVYQSKAKTIKTLSGFKIISKDKSTKSTEERYHKNLKGNSFVQLQMTFIKKQVYCCLLLRFKWKKTKAKGHQRDNVKVTFFSTQETTDFLDPEMQTISMNTTAIL